MPSSVCRGEPFAVYRPKRRTRQTSDRHSHPGSSHRSTVKVAFYGRYSSDNQRDASIEDQYRVVRRWAETHGHQLVAKFSDAAISGANIRLLGGLQEALRSALTSPSPFDAIAVDQLSRLSEMSGTRTESSNASDLTASESFLQCRTACR